MATYLELAEVLQNQEYKRRAAVAVLIKAHAILDSSAPDGHKNWANDVVSAGLASNIGGQMVRKYISQNSNQSLAILQNTLSNDGSMQTIINNIVDNMLSGN